MLGARQGSTKVHWDRALAVAVGLLTAVWVVVYLRATLGDWFGTHLGWDFDHYLAGARAWLETGSPYDPTYLSRRYGWGEMAFVHPPIALLLFTPFLVLPGLLWWMIPLGVIVWSLWSWRPSWIGLTLIFAACAMPLTVQKILVGNSSMWITAFAAYGLRFGWPWALLLMKPTLAPVAILGARDRRAYLGGLLVLLASLAFGSLWLDWVQVARNFTEPWWYTVLDAPMILIPVFAWYTRSNRLAPGLGGRRAEANILTRAAPEEAKGSSVLDR